MNSEWARIADGGDEGRFQQGHHLSALALWYLEQTQEKRDEIIDKGLVSLVKYRTSEKLDAIVPPGPESVPPREDDVGATPVGAPARVGAAQTRKNGKSERVNPSVKRCD